MRTAIDSQINDLREISNNIFELAFNHDGSAYPINDDEIQLLLGKWAPDETDESIQARLKAYQNGDDLQASAIYPGFLEDRRRTDLRAIKLQCVFHAMDQAIIELCWQRLDAQARSSNALIRDVVTEFSSETALKLLTHAQRWTELIAGRKTAEAASEHGGMMVEFITFLAHHAAALTPEVIGQLANAVRQ